MRESMAHSVACCKPPQRSPRPAPSPDPAGSLSHYLGSLALSDSLTSPHSFSLKLSSFCFFCPCDLLHHCLSLHSSFTPSARSFYPPSHLHPTPLFPISPSMLGLAAGFQVHCFAPFHSLPSPYFHLLIFCGCSGFAAGGRGAHKVAVDRRAGLCAGEKPIGRDGENVMGIGCGYGAV
jgi:hypothetical protein